MITQLQLERCLYTTPATGSTTEPETYLEAIPRCKNELSFVNVFGKFLNIIKIQSCQLEIIGGKKDGWLCPTERGRQKSLDGE